MTPVKDGFTMSPSEGPYRDGDSVSFTVDLPFVGDDFLLGQGAAPPNTETSMASRASELEPAGNSTMDVPQANPVTDTTSTTEGTAGLPKDSENEKQTAWSSIATQATAVTNAAKGVFSTVSAPKPANKGEKEVKQTGRFKGGKIFRLSSRSSPMSAEETPKIEPPKPESQGNGSNEDPEQTAIASTLPHRLNGCHNQEEELPGWEDLRERDDHPPGPPPTPRYRFEESFEIRRSALGGVGAFAVRDLPEGYTFLVEAPLLWTTHFRLMGDFNNLSEHEKDVYLNLHGGEGGEPFNRVERIKRLNSFQIQGGIAIFPIAARFNHACWSVRNVRYRIDEERRVLSLTICKDKVLAGAELLIDYGGSPASLYSTFGFICACGGCDSLTDEDIRVMKQQEYGNW